MGKIAAASCFAFLIAICGSALSEERCQTGSAQTSTLSGTSQAGTALTESAQKKAKDQPPANVKITKKGKRIYYNYDEVIKYLYGRKNKRLVRIAHCESFNFKKDIYSLRVRGDEGKAYGIMQFHKFTFYRFAKKYHLENPNIYNPFHQIWLADKMIRGGHIKTWACYYILKRYKRI